MFLLVSWCEKKKIREPELLFKFTDITKIRSFINECLTVFYTMYVKVFSNLFFLVLKIISLLLVFLRCVHFNLFSFVLKSADNFCTERVLKSSWLDSLCKISTMMFGHVNTVFMKRVMRVNISACLCELSFI